METRDVVELGERVALWLNHENSGHLPDLLRHPEFYSLLFRPVVEWK